MKFKWLENKEVSNANWLIAGRIAQMLISLLVGVLTARYLGPSNYGLINYGLAYVTFFSAFCTLGINSIIVKELLDSPSEEGEVIGTTIFLRIISSVLSAVMIVGIVAIVDRGEPITIWVVALCGLSLPFQAWDTINYWFQAQYKSKITAISTLLAYILISLYKIILLVFQKDIIWFALANAIDYFAMAVFLWIAYKKHQGPSLKISKEKAKKLLRGGYHYILASLMIAVYTQTDKIMLKQMLGATDVGFYSVANTICGMWVFVLTAIIDSMYPTILRLFKKDKGEFDRKNKQLYAIVFYCSIFVSVIFLFFGDIAVFLLYGEEYQGSVNPLKMLTWYNAFAYLGVARNAWLVCENRQKYLKYMYFGAAIVNIILNFIFIPIMGATGAALATLITQFCTSILFPTLIKEMRPNAKLMVEAILCKGIFGQKKDENDTLQDV